MPAKQSAGTLLYRQRPRGLEVLLVHPSGPYNRHAPWSIPKGLPDPGESLEAAVRRETREETGVNAGELVELGSIHYTKSRKQIHCFAGPAPEDAEPRCASWEVDCAEFLTMAEARQQIHPEQAPFLDRLLERLESRSREPSGTGCVCQRGAGEWVCDTAARSRSARGTTAYMSQRSSCHVEAEIATERSAAFPTLFLSFPVLCLENLAFGKHVMPESVSAARQSIRGRPTERFARVFEKRFSLYANVSRVAAPPPPPRTSASAVLLRWCDTRIESLRKQSLANLASRNSSL